MNPPTDPHLESVSPGPLRIGRIPFLVCAPFFHRSFEPHREWVYTDGTPSQLNRALSEGRVDLAPGSSLEYARGYPAYQLLPGFSTSGRKEVRSSLLLSKVPWENLTGHTVNLCKDSATSNALFRVLSRFRYRVEPDCQEPDYGEARVLERSQAVKDFEPLRTTPSEGANEETSAGHQEADAVVLIGDPALKEAAKGQWPHVYDLAEAWTRWQRLPFAFGLWMVRREEVDANSDRLRRYHTHLTESVNAFHRDPEAALREWDRHVPLPLPFSEALDFFSSADYGWNAGLENSLRGFYAFAGSMGLCHPEPQLQWAF
jgi:chorismate dehydratase